MSFKDLLLGFTSESSEFDDAQENAERRARRVDRNIQEYELSPSDAVLFEETMRNTVRAMIAAWGEVADGLPSDQLKAVALIHLPHMIAANFTAVGAFLGEVAIHTLIEGRPISPGNPDCPCENCKLARAASFVFNATQS